MSSTEDAKVTEESPPEETPAEAPAKAEEPAAAPEQPEPEAKTEQQEVEQPAADTQKEEVVEDDPEEPDDGVPRVLVTGASGYIATHVTKALLEDGRFRVRGTVRSLKKKEKVQPLRDLVPDAKYPLRLVQADLKDPEGWKRAAKSCSYVFHLASPFPPPSASITDDNIVPIALDGTRNVLQACVDAGTVKRVILTSSVAAISCGSFGSPDKPPNHVYSEVDWSLESACPPYEKSKLKAEQFAWDFVKNIEEEDKKYELVVVNPGYVQGPLLNLASGQGTLSIWDSLIGEKALPALPEVYFPMVDVRDVVKAQIAAMEKPEAAGNRYALVTDTISYKQVAQIVAAEFKPQGYKVPQMGLPKAVMWVAKLFDQQAKAIYPYIGKIVRYNNAKMVRELGVQPHAIKDTVIDTCYSIIDCGGLRKTPGYLGHPSTRLPPPSKEEPSPVTDTSAGAQATSEETPAEPKSEAAPVPKESEPPADSESPAEPKAETSAEPQAEPESEPPAEQPAEAES